METPSFLCGILLLLNIGTAFGSDAPCVNSGGHCQEDNIHCSGGYHTGLCSGHASRRCCMSGSDAPCINSGGHCQEDNIHCSGGYQTGLCSGHASRRCCMSHSASSGQTIECAVGRHRYSATGTAYYPYNNALEGGLYDMRGHPLHTLQDFLEGKTSDVSVAMDNKAGIAYGTRICIPELNRKYHKVINFRVVDTGSAFFGKGHSRIDICVRNQAASYDSTINGHLTLVFP